MEIAAQITTDLFRNGQGDVAERLVLWRDSDQRNLGGWCFEAVHKRILKALVSEESRLSESAKAINLTNEEASNRERIMSDIDKAAIAVVHMVDGLPQTVLDAESIESLVTRVTALRQAYGGPVLDNNEVLRRVDQSLNLRLWDWADNAK